jgi:hypothetical protein
MAWVVAVAYPVTTRQSQRGVVLRLLSRATVSEPGIDRLALQRKDPKHAFMNPPQWLAFDKAIQRFNAER